MTERNTCAFSSTAAAADGRKLHHIERLEARQLLTSGYFADPVSLAMGGATHIIAADFNGDSKPDLAGVATNTLNLLLNNGDGTFGALLSTQVYLSTPGSMLPPLIADLSNLAAADFNGDGMLDLVLGNAALGLFRPQALVFLGTGNGQFTRGPVLDVPDATPGWSTETADFNGDGSMDFMAAGTFFSGHGDGTFDDGVSLLSHSGLRATAVDLNGDGTTDLVGTASPDGVTVLLNLGNGSFTSSVILAQGLVYRGGSLSTDAVPSAVADFDGDGAIDVMTAEIVAPGSPGAFLLYRGRADGTLAEPVELPLAAGTTAVKINDLIASDFNGDQKPDLSVSTDIADVMLIGVGDGSFDSAGGDAGLGQLVAADFDGDGRMDLLSGDSLHLSATAPRNTPLPLKPLRAVHFAAATADDGQGYVFILIGPGSGEVFAAGNGFRVVLQDTTARSTFIVKTTEFGLLAEIRVEGSLARLLAPTCAVTGDVDIAGTIGLLFTEGFTTQDNIIQTHLQIHGAGVPTIIRTVAISDLTLDTASPIRALVSTRWADFNDEPDRLTAPSIGAMLITGGVAGSGWPGTFEADITLTDTGPRTLGVMRVKDTLDGAVIRSAGGIGVIIAGAMRDSSILAGVKPGLASLPTAVADFIAPTSVAAVILTGTPSGGPTFADSLIAASTIGRLSLGDVGSNAATPKPFGVSAGQVTLYVRRSATGLIRRFRNSSPGAFDAVGDFIASIVG